MIVDPDMPDHWKVQMLAGMLGDDPAAPVYLIRLWGHCQNRKKDQFDNLPAMGLRAICKFQGDAEQFEAALIECGFVVRDGKTLTVVGWSEKNSTLCNAWENGKKGGRPKKPTENPRDNPRDNPQKTHGSPDKRREEKNTVPNGTDGEPSLSERVWSDGLETLARLSGKTKRSCRTLLGKWRKTHDDGSVLAAIAEAERQAVSDPAAWITAALKARCPEGRSKVVDAYRELLVPTLPDVIDLDDERKRLIGSLSSGELSTMERWREFFAVVADSQVLTGRKPWRSGETKAVDFDFLLRHAVKIMEGKYDD